MGAGRIIFFNGASSAGKSTLIRELQPLLERPYLHVGVDQYFLGMPRRYFGAAEGFSWTPDERDPAAKHIAVGPVAERVVHGYHRAVAALAADGLDLLLDECMVRPDWLADWLDVLAPFPVLLVGVHCSLAELERRERARGDRMVGQARGHHELVHADMRYDVEVDTSVSGPSECAARIKAAVDGPPPQAFALLQEARAPRRA